jgi:hypothetical protein
MTVKKLIEILQQFPPEFNVQRVMTVFDGITEIERVAVDPSKPNLVVID